MRRALLTAAIAALALPTAALAHVTVVPAFLEDGQVSTLTVLAPNERAPHAMVELSLTAPPGMALTAGPDGARTGSAGWRMTISRTTATWSGGRTPAHAIGEFTIRATTERPPGSVDLRATQRYDDGGIVRWTIPFTVLPAPNTPKQHLWPALLAGIVGVVVIGAGLALLHSRRWTRARTTPR